MDTPSVVGRLRAVVQPAVESAGLVLEDVELVRAGAHSVVRVLVDVAEDDPGALDLDRLGEATALVSSALDADDVVPGTFTLEVSSRGVDRPLTLRRHFLHAVGRRVMLQLRDGGTLVGRLEQVLPEGDGATLVVVPRSDPGKGRRPKDLPPVRVNLEQVRAGRVEVDLSGLGRDEDVDGVDDEDVAGSSAAGRE